MSYYAPLLAACVTLLLIRLLLRSKAGQTIQDIPNARSLHHQPIPRIGGIGLMAGMLSGWAWLFTSLPWWLVLPTLVLFAVSLLDDIHGLPIRRRLLVHGLAAAVLLIGSGMASQNVALALLLLPCVVWMTNLYNFMDGSNGLAGGMAVFGFTTYGIAASQHGDATQAVLNFSTSAAALGFLFYNFHPAKVFMGDAGSIPLGFLAAALGLWGWQSGHWPIWFPALVFSPFAVDATVTLLKRRLRGAIMTEAHREHYYQRLVQIGWGHRNVALFEYVLMSASGASALVAIQQDTNLPWGLFLLWCSLYALLMWTLDRYWKTFRTDMEQICRK